jgi:hypothetical protein
MLSNVTLSLGKNKRVYSETSSNASTRHTKPLQIQPTVDCDAQNRQIYNSPHALILKLNQLSLLLGACTHSLVQAILPAMKGELQIRQWRTAHWMKG